MTTTARKTRTTTQETAESAAELYARAAARETAERDLAARRRAARQAAEVAAAGNLLDGPDRDLADAANRARHAWDAAVADDNIGPEALFALWMDMRRTSAVRAAHVSQASGKWDQLEPIRNDTSGQPTTHRPDVHDSLEPRGELTWALALEAVIQQRATNAAATARREVEDTIRQAGTNAAQAVE